MHCFIWMINALIIRHVLWNEYAHALVAYIVAEWGCVVGHQTICYGHDGVVWQHRELSELLYTVNTHPLLCILYTNCVWQPPFFVPLIPPPHPKKQKKKLILKNENRSHNKWKSVKTCIINPDLVTSLQSMWVCSPGKAMHRVELEYRWTFYAWTSCSSAVCFEGKLADMLISYSLCSSVDGY